MIKTTARRGSQSDFTIVMHSGLKVYCSKSPKTPEFRRRGRSTTRTSFGPDRTAGALRNDPRELSRQTRADGGASKARVV